MYLYIYKRSVTWCYSQDGRRIMDSNRCKLITEDDHYTLLIYEVHPEDAGSYECAVFNKHGRTISTARLTVTGQAIKTRSIL